MIAKLGTVWRRYGLIGSWRLLGDILFTRLAFPSARLVRRPVYIRGRRQMDLGRGLTTGVGLRIDVFSDSQGPVVRIGCNVQVNDYVHIAAIAGVTIGADTLIASKVFITDHDHGDYRAAGQASAPSVAPIDRPLTARPVHIGKRVWLGENVCVLPGVSIGDGSVIGAGSVVTRDIPANSVAVGSPARVIKYYDSATGIWKTL